MSEVLQAWIAIEGWLGRFMPAGAGALAPGADPAAIAQAEKDLGLTFPPDVTESLLRHDGEIAYAGFFPSHSSLLSVAQIVSTRQLLVEVAKEGEDLGRDDSDEWWWHESWLPVTDLDGCLDFVDLRPGPGYGRLGWRPLDGNADFSEGWTSLGAYLSAIATALTTGGGVDQVFPYLTADGELWYSSRSADVLLLRGRHQRRPREHGLGREVAEARDGEQPGGEEDDETSSGHPR